jgi:hypothetical protein
LPRTSKTNEPPPPYPHDDLFTAHGPIHPASTFDALRTLIRNLPMEPGERRLYRNRRICAAIRAVQALAPRDETELMLAVDAVTAHFQAAAHWRASTDGALSQAESLRHLSAAAAATRVFDSMLRAIERRQARPMAESPKCRDWLGIDVDEKLDAVSALVRADENTAVVRADEDAALVRTDEDAIIDPSSWPEAAVQCTQADIDRIILSEDGPIPAGIEGVNPDGSIIVPEQATEAQQDYIGHRIATHIRNERAKRQSRQGLGIKPIIKPLRPGDRVP